MGYRANKMMVGAEVGILMLAVLTILAISHPSEEAHFKECINTEVRRAYVDDDIGNDFDAGVDAGLAAYKTCK